MQRTRRQASLVQQVQAAMSRLDESRPKAHTTPHRSDRHRDYNRAVHGRLIVAGALNEDAIALAPKFDDL
jgi:hypothetical protein